jgi:hypothetical protein
MIFGIAIGFVCGVFFLSMLAGLMLSAKLPAHRVWHEYRPTRMHEFSLN